MGGMGALIVNLAVAFGIFIVGGDAFCKTEKLQLINVKQAPKGCWEHGELHPFFTTWESEDCQHCVCRTKGMECCDHNKIAVGYNPKVCVAYFIKETCTFKVVRKKNHNEDCIFKTVEKNSDSTDSSDSPDADDKKSNSADLKNWEEWDIDDYAEIIQEVDSFESEEIYISSEDPGLPPPNPKTPPKDII
ncbi:beta-microseminoprotein E1-like [Pelodytes ibericus]